MATEPVLALAPLLLAGDHEPGRDVREPDRRGGLVDVLAAGARGAEDVHLDVFLAQVHFDGVVDVGIDEDRGEGGVAPGLRVVRRDPHQPVHALLGLQESVGVLALDLDRDRLDAGLFSRLHVENRDAEAPPLRPADVHPHQHFGPVLGFGAAGAGVNGDDGVPGVVRAPQHGLEFEAVQRGADAVDLGGQLREHRLVGLGLQHLGQSPGLFHAGMDRLVGHQPGLQSLDLLNHAACPLLVGPESGISLLSLQFAETVRLAGQVKESLGARWCGDRVRRGGRSVRTWAFQRVVVGRKYRLQ